MPKRTKKYEESLLEDLRDPVEAAAYLNAALEEIDEPDGMALFLMSLGDVLRAHGVSTVARNAQVGREGTYRATSASGNPKFKSLLALLRGMGLRLAVEAPAPKKAAAHATVSRRKAPLAKAS